MLVELCTVMTGNLAQISLFRKVILLSLRMSNHGLLPNAVANRKFSDLWFSY